MDQASIEAAKDIVASALDIPKDKINDNSSVNDILCWDSMGQMKIVLALELRCDAEVSDEKLESLTSIQNIAQFIFDNK